MLLGYDITVFTDHQNLIHEKTLKASDRVMRWKLLLEEFGIKTVHVKGTKNVLADPMSRLDFQEEQSQDATLHGPHPHHPTVLCSEIMNLEEEDFPLSLSVIHRHQTNCRDTRSLAKKTGFKKVIIDTLPLIQTDDDKIVIPEKHQETVLNWYHYFLNHPGESRMELTMRKKLIGKV